MELYTLESLERVWARSTGHVMGQTDTDTPTHPILTQTEARLSLILRTCWVLSNFTVFFAIIVNIIHHW